MTTRRALLAALGAPPLLGACSALPARSPTGGDAAERLRRLLDDSDEASLQRNPLFALFRGDQRFAARFGDYISDAYVAAERQAAVADLAALAAIPRGELSPVDRIAYDTFRWARQDALQRHRAPAASIWPLLPIDHMNGWHVYFAVLSSGEGAAPYRTVADYDNGLARLDGFVAFLDSAIDRMRQGIAAGVVLPRILVERLLEQFGRFAAQGTDTSPYFGPIRQLSPQIAPADAERLRAAYAAMLAQRLQPAFRRMQRFLAADYLPAARATVGLSALPDGAAFYDELIRSHTTTPLTAAQVHELGRREVERLTQGMLAVKQRVGFQGSLAQFFEHLRSDAAFHPVSAAAFGDGFREIGRRVDAALPKLIDLRPATPLEIRPTPDFQAPTDAGARYSSGSPETGKPGIFYFNTHDLASRSIVDMETLYLHEAMPGHHLQTMLAVENTALPKLLRYEGNTAFNEGWALYAETLGPELGLFGDPYQLFGHYDDAMLRALRLVVDSGLHAFGWTREQAIDTMLAHSAMSRTDATVEVERYIADAGQALAYKVGELTIRRLRQRAEQTLGARFDPRAFHAQVLMTGSIPLSVLEAKIDDWIAASR